MLWLAGTVVLGLRAAPLAEALNAAPFSLLEIFDIGSPPTGKEQFEMVAALWACNHPHPDASLSFFFKVPMS